ncbi:MAG: hypothetical protein LBT65_05055 [Synergistaceae bacterium]|jgi:hypothetical protein|nr:hypothetical protein [Synergistaceae bacterium]
MSGFLYEPFEWEWTDFLEGWIARIVLFGFCYLLLWSVCLFLRKKHYRFGAACLISMFVVLTYASFLTFSGVLDRLAETKSMFPFPFVIFFMDSILPLLDFFPWNCSPYIDIIVILMRYIFLIYPFIGCYIFLRYDPESRESIIKPD